MELEKIQLLAQLVDNTDKAVLKMKEAYADNDSEGFENSKKAILDFKQKINDVLK